MLYDGIICPTITNTKLYLWRTPGNLVVIVVRRQVCIIHVGCDVIVGPVQRSPRSHCCGLFYLRFASRQTKYKRRFDDDTWGSYAKTCAYRYASPIIVLCYLSLYFQVSYKHSGTHILRTWKVYAPFKGAFQFSNVSQKTLPFDFNPCSAYSYLKSFIQAMERPFSANTFVNHRKVFHLPLTLR